MAPLVIAALAEAAPKIINGVMDEAKTLIDRLVPDKALAEKVKAALAEKVSDQQFQRDMAQMQINLADAQSGHWWQSGWRPAIGWVCVAILGLSYIPKALVLTGFWAYQCYLVFSHPGVTIPAMPAFPDLGLTDVLGILGTLLGAGWMAKLRTDEKKTGVS